MGSFIDLSGKRFGRLVAIKIAKTEKNKKVTKFYWLCKCDCGKEKIINGAVLRSGHALSCGCYQKEKFIETLTKHNLSNSSLLYNVWRAMKRRCYYKKEKRYKNYGGRGIKVCDEWIDKEKGFINFYNWAINNGYKEEKLLNGLNKWTLDRIDVNGNYEPNNCRFITVQEQSMNTTKSIYITYKNKTLSLKEWSKITNIDYRTLYSRFYYKWEVEKMLTKPVQKHERRNK